MRAYHQRQKNYDPEAHDPDEGDNAEYWKLVRPRQSLKIWKFQQAVQGMNGPQPFYSNCWADEPAWLIHDLTLIGEYWTMQQEWWKKGPQ